MGKPFIKVESGSLDSTELARLSDLGWDVVYVDGPIDKLEVVEEQPGLLDKFAMAALSAVQISWDGIDSEDWNAESATVAKTVYSMAGKMMYERAKNAGPVDIDDEAMATIKAALAIQSEKLKEGEGTGSR